MNVTLKLLLVTTVLQKQQWKKMVEKSRREKDEMEEIAIEIQMEVQKMKRHNESQEECRVFKK